MKCRAFGGRDYPRRNIIDFFLFLGLSLLLLLMLMLTVSDGQEMHVSE